jgi:hypothetical protein
VKPTVAQVNTELGHGGVARRKKNREREKGTQPEEEVRVSGAAQRVEEGREWAAQHGRVG